MKAVCDKSPANKLSAMMKVDNGPTQSSRRQRKLTGKNDNSECAPPTKRSRRTPKEKDDDKAGNVQHEKNATSTTRKSRACRAKTYENKLTNGDIAASHNQDQNNNLDKKKGSKKSNTIKRECGEENESNDKSKLKQTISKSPPSSFAAPTATGRTKRKSASKVKSYKESQSSDREEKEDSDPEPKVKQKPSANAESSKSNKKGSESSPDVGKPVTGKKKAPRKPTVKKRGTPKPVVKVEDVTKSHMMEKSDSPKTKRDENTPTTSQTVEIKMEADKPAIEPTAVMDDGSSSDDSGDDWEEVADLPDNSPVKKDVQITMDAPADKKKKKGFDWAAYARRLWKRHQKKQHECTHQIELMCLLTHGQLVNDTCNDDLLKGFAMSLCGKTNLKGKQCNIGNIQKVVKILKQRISVECQPTEVQYLDTQTILDVLESELQSGTLSRSDHFVVLLIAVLRALGAAVRLCTAWYPISWRISHYQKQIRQEKFKSNKGESGCPEDDKPKNKSKGKGKESPDSGRKRVPPERPFGRKIVVPDLDKQTWLEVYITSDQTWLTIDSNGDIITDMKSIEENLRRPVTYIMSYDNGGKVKDVTQKYDSSWMTGTMKLRVSSEWWEEMLAPYHVKESKKTKQEDEKIKSQQEQMPFPNTIGGFKDHPLYALERHILKFQGIYPSTAVPLGYTKTKEPIYSRSCVHTLHSRETWLKEALQIKIGEEAYKFVKPRPKMSDIKNGIKITEATLPVYGLWQTEKYVPPTAENGKVPRNGYGNVELFKPEMLPGGCVHLPHNSIGRLARRMDIDCAQAMIGWDSHSGCSVPMFDGWVVCEEHEDTLMGALEEYEAEMAKKEQDKLEKRIYGNWKKLIKGLLIRERLRNRYGKDNF